MQYLLVTSLDSCLLLLLQAVGISVEFCSHIVRSFSVSTLPRRVDRATDALIKTGSSVCVCVVCCDFMLKRY